MNFSTVRRIKSKEEKLVDKMKEKKNGLGLRVFVILIFIIIFLTILLLVTRGFIGSKNDEIKELKSKIAEMESRQTEVDSIKEEVKEISKYSAYEFTYTSVIHFSDNNTFKGFNIPLTGNNFIATIDGKMNIGINGEGVDISETKDSKGKVTQVTLTVPHSEIQDNYTIQDSLEIYDERNNIFNPVKVTDYNELIIEAEEKEKEKVLESDILQKSDERINYLLMSYLQQVYGEDVEIKYEYLNSTESSAYTND